MRMTRAVLGLAFVAGAVVACSSSSGPTSYLVSGACDPLSATLVGTSIQLTGPCTLGPAGDYTLDAGLLVNLGACGDTPVAITADFIQSAGVLYSTFSGQADIPCKADGGIDLLSPIDVGGTFTYVGGTGPFVDATGSADAGGTVTASLSGFSANLNLSGNLSY